jgi:perosamine synthetase
MSERIHYTLPSITDLEIGYATDAATHGWGERCYAYIQRFEDLFKAHLGVPYAIATSSCTGALHIGMAALGVGSGDEVILADTNWIASAAPIHHLGATPVFVDICPDTWCLDPQKVQAAITPRTKAILAVHLYGNLCDMEALLAIGHAHGIAVIEDSAEAIGSVYHGQRAGSMGTFGSFSFHGTKTITTGEGGMFVTSDEKLFDTALTLSNHGRSKHQKKQFWPDMVGFKYKMSNIQAAIGCGQMERIDALTKKKRDILDYYREKLIKIPGVSMNPVSDALVNGAWMPTVVFDKKLGINKEKLLQAFAKQNIDARVFFHPLSGMPMFKPCPENTHAWDIPERALNLPSFHDITHQQLDTVVKVITAQIDYHAHR